MLTSRWGAAVVITALGAGVTLYLRGAADGRSAQAANSLELVGHVDAPGIDPTRCIVRCATVRLESQAREHWADIEPDGSFRLTGLADTDYRIEILARHDLTLLMGLAEYARPGRELLLFVTDPTAPWARSVAGIEQNAD